MDCAFNACSVCLRSEMSGAVKVTPLDQLSKTRSVELSRVMIVFGIVKIEAPDPEGRGLLGATGPDEEAPGSTQANQGNPSII